MKWITERPTTPIATLPTVPFDGIIAGRLRLYEQMGWVSDVTDDDIDAAIKAAQATEQRILDAGLNPKPHGVYRLGLIPACFAALQPHLMRQTLRDLLGQQSYNGWGYLSTIYYGTADSAIRRPDGFSTDDIGKVLFLVEDEDAPNRNFDMPGSLLTNMPWGEERDAAWQEWKQKFAAVNPHALNYASHSLIWLGDTAGWGNALGRVGCYDYVEQPYDISRRFCPYGNVDADEAAWRADGTDADSCYAVAAVVW
jgi:hypothetical protein